MFDAIAGLDVGDAAAGVDASGSAAESAAAFDLFDQHLVLRGRRHAVRITPTWQHRRVGVMHFGAEEHHRADGEIDLREGEQR